MTASPNDVPNPGSPAAVKQGCRCPMTDNANGRGIDTGDGLIAFWQSTYCPIHFNPTMDALREAVGK